MRKSHLLCWVAGLTVVSSLPGQAKFNQIAKETIQARLQLYKGDDRVREQALVKIFLEAGCPARSLSAQPVPGRKEANVICTLPGATDSVILVGAHFDHVAEGDGIVDNWTGASLIPSLFQSLAGTPRKHTFIFVGFTGEEDGLIGSTYYVKQLAKAELAKIDLMVVVDSVGLRQLSSLRITTKPIDSWQGI